MSKSEITTLGYFCIQTKETRKHAYVKVKHANRIEHDIWQPTYSAIFTLVIHESTGPKAALITAFYLDKEYKIMEKVLQDWKCTNWKHGATMTL